MFAVFGYLLYVVCWCVCSVLDDLLVVKCYVLVVGCLSLVVCCSLGVL